MKDYISICKLNEDQIGKYKSKIITRKVILTNERLNNHILIYHKQEYSQVKQYIPMIIKNPDLILEDKSHENTLIYLKHISEINKKARIVVRLATNKEERTYNQNSIITIMRQREKSWKQTIKNRGKIIFQKELDKNV